MIQYVSPETFESNVNGYGSETQGPCPDLKHFCVTALIVTAMAHRSFAPWWAAAPPTSPRPPVLFLGGSRPPDPPVGGAAAPQTTCGGFGGGAAYPPTGGARSPPGIRRGISPRSSTSTTQIGRDKFDIGCLAVPDQHFLPNHKEVSVDRTPLQKHKP